MGGQTWKPQKLGVQTWKPTIWGRSKLGSRFAMSTSLLAGICKNPSCPQGVPLSQVAKIRSADGPALTSSGHNCAYLRTSSSRLQVHGLQQLREDCRKRRYHLHPLHGCRAHLDNVTAPIVSCLPLVPVQLLGIPSRAAC